ncbi:MAG: DUF2164 domain-containing protein [Gammaproteobacteria bacterium]|jgi:uncharacterized protein (DUF2164 family)|nr:hypothetical protein [Gammaproteobacteria bacterium]MDP6095387.1 DUF2164 domain-containing protein [Gammaproteobacteria bacterium]MDP7455220.1 DUF2164 domain-containing protein [Gammaproteobacteria bacterium]HJO10878.1 DUF2164 domain-containing protein [Gammaproteobacteria bacterium]|tara:strand:- start:1761 stop:2003 length:243 start_codon:yes stop_codon:yes gene_type:complete
MIEFDKSVKEELVKKIQQYCAEELQHEVGSFEAQFLLDFFSEEIGGHFYNQGLADALKTFESRYEEIADSIYQLEKLSSD